MVVPLDMRSLYAWTDMVPVAHLQFELSNADGLMIDAALLWIGLCVIHNLRVSAFICV